MPTNALSRTSWVPKPRREHFWLFIFIVVSLSIQFFLLPHNFIGQDTRKFLEIAVKAQSLEFWSSPDAFDGNYWSIGYPTFIALSWGALGSTSILAIQVIQIVMAASLVPITWSLAYSQGPHVRILSAALAAVSPTIIFLGQNGGYEILLGWLLCLSLSLAWWGGDSTSTATNRGVAWFVGVAAGLTFGLAIEVQNKALVLLPVLLYLMWKWGCAPRLLFVSFASAPLLAWSLRNLIVLGYPAPLSSNGPINMWLGNNGSSIAGGFMQPTPRLSDGTHNFISGAVDFWISQPEASVTIMLRKIARLLEPLYMYPEEALPRGVGVLINYSVALYSLVLTFLFCVYIFGRIWGSSPSIPRVGPLSIAFLGFFLINLPFIGEPRFRTPLEPVLIVTALSTGAALAAKWIKVLRPFRTSPKSRL